MIKEKILEVEIVIFYYIKKYFIFILGDVGIYFYFLKIRFV